MRRLAPVVSFVVLAAACGGSVSTVDGSSSGNASSSSSSGGSSSGTVSSSSSSSSSSGSTGGTCTTSTIPGNRACVPGVAVAEKPTEIQIDDTESCLGCRTTVDSCVVAMQGNKLVVSMSARTCPGPGECPPVCGSAAAKCTLPALPAGEYEVALDSKGPTNGFAPRKLVVAASGGQSSCELVPAGTPVQLDPLPFSTSCSTDFDCRLATFGNVCQPCSCPTGAIASGAGDAYEAKLRELRSQCADAKDPIACGACAPVKATCFSDGTSLTGTCKLVPGN